VSVEAEAWAWKQKVSSTEKIVLVRLANRSDEHGVCWPGQKGIAEDCSLSRETVNRAVKHLVELKKLTIIPRQDALGRPMSNYYQLSVNEGGNVTDDHRVCDPASQGIVTDDHTNSHIEQSIEQKAEINPPNRADADSPVEWRDDVWLWKFLKEQHVFNGNRLPKLLDNGWWSDLSEAVNGVDLPFVTTEFGKMGVWLRDNPARAPTDKGVRRFVATWLERAASRRRNQNAGQKEHRH
jgi:Helix-turn-helix domain